MSFNLSLRLGAAIFMTTTAIASLLFLHLFGTAWSNHCDPGNAQFYLLKNDPVVKFQAPGELYTWENDQPDNGWLCTGPHLALSHVGTDVKGMFMSIRANLFQSGWSGGDLFLPDQDFGVFDKYVEGQHLTAVVNEEFYGVDVGLDAPALHLGESGFS